MLISNMSLWPLVMFLSNNIAADSFIDTVENKQSNDNDYVSLKKFNKPD